MAQETVARPRQEGSGKKLSLFLGLGLGVIAAILVAVVLTRDNGKTVQKTVPATRVAVVAAQDIPAHTRLTPDLLKVQTFKPEDVNPDAFVTTGQVTNRVTANDMVAGQVFVPSLVSDTTGQTLTFTVDQGMRAVSIGVKEVVTAGGNILPGNQVDIIGVFDINKGADVNQIITSLTGQPGGGPIFAPDNATLTLTVLQNVKVLAVAQKLPTSLTATNSNPADKENPNPGAATVTLAITPQQAQVLALIDNKGTLRLSLRPFGETNVAQVNPILTVLK
jgi:pilus assembly protein CpaB